MDSKKEIKNLTQKERTIVAILTGWTLLHLVLVFISDGRTRYFWPFDTEPQLRADYDFSEFMVYGIIPWVIFIVYKFLNRQAEENKPDEKQ